MIPEKDTFFADRQDPVGPFEFNEAVTAVFDDMIKRSVPLYMESIKQQCRLAHRYYRPGSRIYDLGCSHGNLGVMLHKTFTSQPYSMIAVDSAPSMLQRYRERLRNIESTMENSELQKISEGLISNNHIRSTDITRRKDPITDKDRDVDIKHDDLCHDRPTLERHGIEQCGSIRLVCAPAETIEIDNASVVIVNLTLQFIKPEQRNRFIQTIHDGMVPGGILLLSEKVIHEEKEISKLQREVYEGFKRENGYSDLEISRKREALENILIPESVETHQRRLQKAGFEKMDVWLKWFNFTSLIAIK